MKLKTWLYLAGGVLWGCIPAIASAALVPCGQGSEPTVWSALSCDLCGFGQLVQNIINFLVGISIPIAVIMFGYAGILMFTSGVGGDSGRLKRGKDIFKSVFLGFVLVISGWLIVQTVLSVVVDGTFFIGGKWNSLQCVEKDDRNETTQGSVSGFINSVLGNPPVLNPVTSGTPSVSYQCPTGYALRTDGDCRNAAGDIKPPTPVLTTSGGSGILGQSQLQAQLNAASAYASGLREMCSQQGLTNSQCDLALAMMSVESSGNARCSGKSACGLMQVLPGTACEVDPTMCGLSYDEYKQRVNNDPQLGMELGVKYLKKQLNSFDTNAEAIAAYNAGPGRNQNSHVSGCENVRVWECQKNSGFQETRDYVTNVTNTLALIPK